MSGASGVTRGARVSSRLLGFLFGFLGLSHLGLLMGIGPNGGLMNLGNSRPYELGSSLVGFSLGEGNGL